MIADGRGQHPNSKANLNPAKKGEVRNPKGRGNTKSLKSILKDKLNSDGELKVAGYRLDEEGRKTTEWVEVAVSMPKKEAIVLKFINKAYKMDDISAFKLLWESLEGKAVQPVIQGSTITDDPDLFETVMGQMKKAAGEPTPPPGMKTPNRKEGHGKIETEDEY